MQVTDWIILSVLDKVRIHALKRARADGLKHSLNQALTDWLIFSVIDQVHPLQET
jgi:hypothetical protein